tara:strand:- start:7 stop:624 length:618 start_codon:yes stop_codon:yes gene_type:complete
MKTLGIIDCNIGNVYSLENALKKLNCSYIISKEPKELEKFDKIILLGVGSFPAVMSRLRKHNFIGLLESHVKKGKHLLGICVGMQVLMTNGLEGEKTKGLNFIKGSVIPLKYSKNFPIPHIGWNEVNFESKSKIQIFDQIKNESSFYFVHSYHTVLKEKIKTATSQHGKNKFISAFNKNNIYGVQFHPEKSQITGMKILKNFFEL